MSMLRNTRIWVLAGIMLLACGGVPWLAAEGQAATKKFASKECTDCHTKFSDKYFSMKYLHTIVKEKKCEDCHIRHGRVPKLLLKKEGNQICLGCHTKEKIGLTKTHVHTPLK